MVNKRLISGLIAAFSLVLAFPALASAHTLSVSAGPSQCVTSNGANTGQYSSTVTITEQYFGGTTEVIPAGINVHESSSSTDKGNTGLNQNYFTQGAVGTQTGPLSLRAAHDVHLAQLERDGHADVHGHHLGAGDVRARQQLHGLSVDGVDHRAEERVYAAAELSERRHARQRRVRTSDELPVRGDPDRWRVRASDELPLGRDPLGRQVRTSDHLPQRRNAVRRRVRTSYNLSQRRNAVGR